LSAAKTAIYFHADYLPAPATITSSGHKPLLALPLSHIVTTRRTGVVLHPIATSSFLLCSLSGRAAVAGSRGATASGRARRHAGTGVLRLVAEHAGTR